MNVIRNTIPKYCNAILAVEVRSHITYRILSIDEHQGDLLEAWNLVVASKTQVASAWIGRSFHNYEPWTGLV